MIFSLNLPWKLFEDQRVKYQSQWAKIAETRKKIERVKSLKQIERNSTQFFGQNGIRGGGAKDTGLCTVIPFTQDTVLSFDQFFEKMRR